MNEYHETIRELYKILLFMYKTYFLEISVACSRSAHDRPGTASPPNPGFKPDERIFSKPISVYSSKLKRASKPRCPDRLAARALEQLTGFQYKCLPTWSVWLLYLIANATLNGPIGNTNIHMYDEATICLCCVKGNIRTTRSERTL